MNPTREEALFVLLLTKPDSERPAFLDRECAGDPALRQRLEVLLPAHETTGHGTGCERRRCAVYHESRSASELPDEAVGQTISRYKLLDNVGEGRCGVVYVAEQTEPVRRRVALKVIKLPRSMPPGSMPRHVPWLGEAQLPECGFGCGIGAEGRGNAAGESVLSEPTGRGAAHNGCAIA